MVEPNAEVIDDPIDVEPPFSDKKWSDYVKNKELLQTLEKYYSKPSWVQFRAADYLNPNNKKNLIAKSRNGSGKTVAFLVPAIMHVDTTISGAKEKKGAPQSLIICHQTNIANQVYEVLKKLCENNTNINLSLFTHTEKSTIQKIEPAHIVVTQYSGKTWDLLINNYSFENLKIIVFDEADFYFTEEKNSVLFNNILLYLRKEKRVECKITLFSATYNPNLEEFQTKIKKSLDSWNKNVLVAYDAETLDVEEEHVDLSRVKIYVLKTRRREKFKHLIEYFSKTEDFPGSSIIFVNSRKYTQDLGKRILQTGNVCDVLEGSQAKATQNEVLEGFNKGDFRYLFTTDIISRGYDNPRINSVIVFDLPYIHTRKINSGSGSRIEKKQPDFPTLTHRIGRTGRFMKKGIVLIMVEQDMQDKDDIQFLEDFAKAKGIKKLYYLDEGANWDEMLKTLDCFNKQNEKTEE